MSKDTGGAAFPVLPPIIATDYPWPEAGMSLRDYAAIHSTPPGCSEIVAMAGLKWRAGRVWLSMDTGISFDLWWETIPLAERLDLCAKVRYAQADAMIAEKRRRKK